MSSPRSWYPSKWHIPKTSKPVCLQCHSAKFWPGSVAPVSLCLLGSTMVNPRNSLDLQRSSQLCDALRALDLVFGDWIPVVCSSAGLLSTRPRARGGPFAPGRSEQWLGSWLKKALGFNDNNMETGSTISDYQTIRLMSATRSVGKALLPYMLSCLRLNFSELLSLYLYRIVCDACSLSLSSSLSLSLWHLLLCVY